MLLPIGMIVFVYLLSSEMNVLLFSIKEFFA